MIRKLIFIALMALCLVLPVSAFWPTDGSADQGHEACAIPYFTYLPGGSFTTGNLSQADAFCACTGHGSRSQSWVKQYHLPNKVASDMGAGYTTYPRTGTATANYTVFMVACGGGYRTAQVGYRIDMAPVLEVNFTGTPTTGNAPHNVLFTATNVTNTTGMSWSFGDGNVTSTTATTTTHLYQNQGMYTVILGYFNVSGVEKSVQKNNYITVGAPNATSTTYAVARDLYTGFAINGAQVDMYDVENTSWTNTTAINGEGSITTLLGHTINIWGSATGYEDDNLIGVPEVDGGYYSLLLRPTNLTTHNVTPGNLTLAVTVQDLQIPHQTLSGAEVTAAWGSQYTSGTSNAAGSVFFAVPNNTAIHLSAFKSGYASGSSTHITGTANGGSTMETAIVYIGTDYVTPIPSVTLTTGPGGTIPQTVDPYPCIGDGSAQDTANCQRKQGSMAADLISYGPDLVKFFIMLTFIGGLLLITGKR